MMSLARAGRRLPGCRRGGLRWLIVLAALAGSGALTSGAAGAGGVSGGAGVPSGSSSKPSAPRHPRVSGPAPSPLGSRGMWIWYVSASNGGDLTSMLATAQSYGISTLIIKAGDGTTPWSQFNSQLVAELHAAGLRACAWQYVYGAHPISEAYVGADAVRAGADCLFIDAESEYEGRYIQAQAYVKRLRQLIGSRFPVALAGFPYIDYHPAFPYSVFLGPGGAQYNA
ncbi:MAG: hypothetical protein JO244_09790, partial [Solirubrobacterales bacterium]|nr:hypothetical protein [Solirubrobacterales bacterium]